MSITLDDLRKDANHELGFGHMATCVLVQPETLLALIDFFNTARIWRSGSIGHDQLLRAIESVEKTVT